MSIQDLILGAGSIVFVIALIPSILSDNKPALSSCITTGAVLLVFSGTYASLDLWFSTVTTFLSAACWLTLAAQQFRRRKA